MSLFFASMPIVAVHVFYCFFKKISFKMTQNFTRAGGGGGTVGRLSPRTTPKSTRAGGIKNIAVSNIVFGTKNFNPQNTQR